MIPIFTVQQNKIQAVPVYIYNLTLVDLIEVFGVMEGYTVWLYSKTNIIVSVTL